MLAEAVVAIVLTTGGGGNVFEVPRDWQHPDRVQYPKWGQQQSPDGGGPGGNAGVASPSSPAGNGCPR